MPAPKTPNTAAASEARRQIGLEKAAEKLREAGWLALSPEQFADLVAIAPEIRGYLHRYEGYENA